MHGTICIFEDESYRKLLPLVYTRPVYELRCGITSLRQKITEQYQEAKVILHCRDYLVDSLTKNCPDIAINQINAPGCLFINGRVVADRSLADKIPLQGPDEVFIKDSTVVAARLSGDSLSQIDLSCPLKDSNFKGKKTRIKVDLANYFWDLVYLNTPRLEDECKSSGRLGIIEGKVYPGVHLVEKANIHIAEGVSIKPGAVLDAEEGPIFIDKGVRILPNANIEGPAYIGPNSLVREGARILTGSSVGKVCKVGGEIEESIIHSYSNKQHEGFLGHAYVGMWVNLAAGTNNSDLKNNYSRVKVYVDGELVDSGLMFVGAAIGDHSKSAIGTCFNTGTVAGVSCNILGAEMPPKFIPSFAWGGSDRLATYELGKAIQVCRQMMARRKVEMSETDITLLTKIFELTEMERDHAGVNSLSD